MNQKHQKYVILCTALLFAVSFAACTAESGSEAEPIPTETETSATTEMTETAETTNTSESTASPQTAAVSETETETQSTTQASMEAPTEAPTENLTEGTVVKAGYLHCVLELDPYTKVDDSRIKIVYPQLDSDTAEAKAINDLILGKVQEVVDFADGLPEEVWGEEAEEREDAYCSVHCSQYEIARDDEKYLSIVWYGYWYCQWAAHPNNYMDAIIIDKETLTEVTLPDLYRVDDAFSETLKAETADALEEWRQAYLREDDEMTLRSVQSWLDTEPLLQSSKAFETGTDAYLSEEGLVLSLGIPHAMGDYMEVTVPYAAIEAYRK